MVEDDAKNQDNQSDDSNKIKDVGEYKEEIAKREGFWSLVKRGINGTVTG